MRRINRILGVCVSALLGVTAMGVMSPANAQVPPNVVLPMDTVINGCTIVDNPTETNFTDCPGAKWGTANLKDLNLSYANLSGADLVLTNLEGTNFTGANLSGANLSGANLEITSFADANLTDADYRSARLVRTTFSGSSVCPEPRLVSVDGQPVSFTSRGAPLNVSVDLSASTLSPSNTPSGIEARVGSGGLGACIVHVVQPPLVVWGVMEVSGKEGDALTSTLGTMSSAFPSARVNAANLPAGVNVSLSPTGELTVSGTPTVNGTFNRTVSVCNNAAVDPDVETCVNGNITFSIAPADAPSTPPATPTPAPATPESTTPQPQGQPQSLKGDLPATGSTSPALVVFALALIGAGAFLRRLATATTHS